MDIIIFGSGMMGRAIAYDLAKFSSFDKIEIVDQNKEALKSADEFLKNKKISFSTLDVNDNKEITNKLKDFDIAISAVPYKYNFYLAKAAVNTKTHFLDLGGNNTVVEQEKTLHSLAQKNKSIIIPDCGLAPGLVSIITQDIVENMDSIDYVKHRVGGLPINPKPPFNYELVFSPEGLINEYVEDALVLENGEIITKKSMTELETIEFPKPYQKMEAFITSGGTSTLPYTYKDKIKNLDYKTIRYPGHCNLVKTFLDLGFENTEKITKNDIEITPREIFIKILRDSLPQTGEDMVLLKTFSQGEKDNKNIKIEYIMMDSYDKKTKITAMMKTTGYPASIIAQLIEQQVITKPGVYCPEEIVPSHIFFEELKKRKINLEKNLIIT